MTPGWTDPGDRLLARSVFGTDDPETARRLIGDWAFVRAYEQARGMAFTPPDLAEIEAGATYARAYKARCEHAIDPDGARWRGSSRESLQADGPFRL